MKGLIKTNQKTTFEVQFFEKFKAETLTVSELLSRIATYSGLSNKDYEAIHKMVEKIITKENKEITKEIKK